MHKSLRTLAALPTLLPALTLGTLVTTDSAEARMRMGFGGAGFHQPWAQRQVFSPHWGRKNSEPQAERRVHRAKPVVSDNQPKVEKVQKTEKVERRAEPTPPPAPVIKYVDGRGRQYDLKSQTWFDGQSQCWTSRSGWAYKDGGWFHGSARWYEADGTWRSAAATPATPVDCERTPLFAAKIQKGEPRITVADKPGAYVKPDIAGALAATKPPAAGEATSGRLQPSSGALDAPTRTEPVIQRVVPVAAPRVETAPVKPAVAAKGLCDKYFPSIGQVLSVPCSE